MSEKTKIFLTDNCLDEGHILAREADLSMRDEEGRFSVLLLRSQVHGPIYQRCHPDAEGTVWHRSLSAAVDYAEKLRQDEIRHLQDLEWSVRELRDEKGASPPG